MYSLEEREIQETIQETIDYRHQFGLLLPITLAKVLGIYPHTLKLWRIDDKGPNYVRVGKRVWYLYDDVLTWLEESRHMTSKRKNYSKMVSNPGDVSAPGPKRGEPVKHPSEVPPPTPDKVNLPPDDADVVDQPDVDEERDDDMYPPEPSPEEPDEERPDEDKK